MLKFTFTRTFVLHVETSKLNNEYIDFIMMRIIFVTVYRMSQ